MEIHLTVRPDSEVALYANMPKSDICRKRTSYSRLFFRIKSPVSKQTGLWKGISFGRLLFRMEFLLEPTALHIDRIEVDQAEKQAQLLGRETLLAKFIDQHIVFVCVEVGREKPVQILGYDMIAQ